MSTNDIELTQDENAFLQRVALHLIEKGVTPETFNQQVMMDAMQEVIDRDKKLAELYFNNKDFRREFIGMVYHACREEI